jgi:hypothetical protein
MRSRNATCAAGLVLLGLLAGACGDDGEDGKDGEAAPSQAVIDPGDGGTYAPAIGPSDFVEVVDNPYFPLRPGARWVYEGDSDGEPERVEVVVTDQRRQVMGVEVTVVRDTVTDANGDLVEDTLDWFAQDRRGNVWYFGEESKDYEDGEVVSTDGSWEAGVDGALPGIVMPATHTVGFSYRQEYDEGEAEDMAEIRRVGVRKAVALRTFEDVVVTRDWNPLEPDVVEEKYYAPGVGLIFETKTAGDEGSIELVVHTGGA